jgi:hypothetical protein
VHFTGQAPKTPPSAKDDQMHAIGLKGVAGYYEFKPFSAIS